MQNVAAGHRHANKSNKSVVPDLEAITLTLELLLAQHQATLKAEGMERQARNLKRWLEENHKTFTTAGIFPEAGKAWLSDLCDSLKWVVEEKQRLEGEGGLPATKEEIEQNEQLLNTIRRLEKILHIESVQS